jgi:hypothetical protein
MPPVGFKPTIPASERPQTHTLGRVATGIDTQTLVRTRNLVSHVTMKACLEQFIALNIGAQVKGSSRTMQKITQCGPSFFAFLRCTFLNYVCIVVLHTLVAGLLARSQYPEGPPTGQLGTGFSWFPCVYKRMLRWFPRL